MKKSIFKLYVSGIHCESCKIFIEDALTDLDIIQNARVDLKEKTLEFESGINKNPKQLAKILTERLNSNGYTVSINKYERGVQSNRVVWKSLPFGFGFLALFFLFQKSGVLNIGIGGRITPISSFVIGVIASLSSCLAVVGGLVLSLSAKLSQKNANIASHITVFHAGRLASFALFGGVLGAIGTALRIDPMLSTALGLMASATMVVLGLNLLEIGNIKKISLPSSIFNFLNKQIAVKPTAPFMLGIITFFLPCGFTQSMQLSALSSGSFLSGLLIMGSFALGTLPMLALFSFGSASFAKSHHALLFYKSAGIVVVFLGVFSLLSGLAILGLIPPLN
jgi:sulfite exporter TauE/SafE/copper chaperone CopZ